MMQARQNIGLNIGMRIKLIIFPTRDLAIE
jgi:hypothetical protein